MQELEGIWWTPNHKKVIGKLTITDENKIILTTYEKLYDTNIICGFSKNKEITLVDINLDRTNIYIGERYKDNNETDDIDKEELKYCVYKYVAEIAIYEHIYGRKGDIKLKEISLYYTNLEKWIDWKIKDPEIENKGKEILLKINKFKEKLVRTEKFELIIDNPYLIEKTPCNIKIINQVKILIRNIKNEYIKTIQSIAECLQCFLILCMGDNINIEKINATDIFDRKIEVILGYGKSNYENRSIFKNIVKYKEIEKDIENIIKNWIEIYEENELLVTNFIKLQTTEDLLVNEYMNLMSAIDSLHLVVTKKEQSKEPFAGIVENLLTETNFILDFSEAEIKNLAEKIKNIRRYFIHSNKTQKQIVHSNISMVVLIINILIEAIRSRIMIEIGIDKDILEKYYKNFKNLKNIKYKIVNNINQDEEIISERIKDGGKVI